MSNYNLFYAMRRARYQLFCVLSANSTTFPEELTFVLLPRLYCASNVLRISQVPPFEGTN